MKIALPFVAALVLVATGAVPARIVAAAHAQTAEQRAASLVGIQDRILDAANRAYAADDFTGYAAARATINKVDPGGAAAVTYWKNYWSAFLDYQNALSLMRASRRDEARVTLGRSIDTLKAIASPDAEVNALLGLAAGLNLQFVPRQQIVIAAQQTNAYLRDSVASPKASPRSYYASAIADWNTPITFGGTLKAEGLAKKALSMRETPSQLRPTWGRDAATELLIRIHLARKEGAAARALYESAKRDFPDSSAIKELAGQV